MTKYFKNSVPYTKPLVPDLHEYTEYIKKIFNTGAFTNNGPFFQDLELQIKEKLNVSHCSVYNNGTTALMIALRALDLNKNDIKCDIVVTPFTFPATVNVLLWNELKPIFCDVDYETMNITPEKTERCLDSYVTGIMPVHVFGCPCDVKGFKDLAKIYNKKLIYDAAHAFAVEIDDTGIGNYGDFTMFSFHPTKLFHTGEGGALTCNDIDLHTDAKQLRNFGIKDDITGSILPGINGKMNELQAAIGLEILKQIDEEIEKRKKIFEFYRSCLGPYEWIKILNMPENIKQNYLYFPIRFIGKSRDKIYNHLIENNVYARKYFYPLCHEFKHLRQYYESMPIAEKISEEILCLPCYGSLSQDDIYNICNLIIQA